MSLFEKNKSANKVENPYNSLGLLQQTMMVSSTGHHDLSVVCQTQTQWTSAACGGAGQPIAHPPSLQAVLIIIIIIISVEQPKMPSTVAQD